MPPPVCQAATKTTLAYRKKLLAQWSRCEGVYQPSRRSKRDFFRRSGGKGMEWMVPAQGTVAEWTLSPRESL